MFSELMERGSSFTYVADDPKRILILMSNTGGGHRAAAEAIQEALRHLYGGAVSVSIVDAWQHHVAWPVNQLSKSYSWIINEALWMWKAFWLLEHKPRLVDSFVASVYPLVAPGLFRLFKTYQPDVVVSVHPLITQLPLKVLKRARLNVPFITVVTDMVKGYPTWYHPQTTQCLVPTEPARQQALRLGVSPQKVKVVGQAVSLKFAKDIAQPKTVLRRQLNLDLNRPAVLLVGGGEGFGPIYKIARALARQVSNAQLIIVAGRNELLREKLEETVWEIPTTVYGFVDNMPGLMGASDLLITKAGPGCLSEAFVTGLPLILFDYIPGQEEENITYVVNNNAGAYITDPAEIAARVSEWLTPNNTTLMKMTQNAVRLARPEAALTIAQKVYDQATVYRNSFPLGQWQKQYRMGTVPQKIPGFIR